MNIITAHNVLAAALAMIISFSAHAAEKNAADVKPSTPLSAKTPLVVVISIDGLGSHLLSSMPVSEVPTLTKLAQNGDQAIRAETILKAQTIPGHVSMLTGVDTPKHGRIHNELDSNLQPVDVPTIFDLAKMNGKSSIAIFGKEKLRFIFDTASLAENVSPRLWPIGDYWGRLPSVVEQTAIKALEKKPDFIFVHYAIVDTIGHAVKWESALQRYALRRVDASLGRLVAHLESSFEDYVLIVTADHGGHDGSHGQTDATGTLQSPETDLVIPWIISRGGTNSRPNEISVLTPQKTVFIYDTAATIASLMGLNVPHAWRWDGQNRVALSAKPPEPNATKEK